MTAALLFMIAVLLVLEVARSIHRRKVERETREIIEDLKHNSERLRAAEEQYEAAVHRWRAGRLKPRNR